MLACISSCMADNSATAPEPTATTYSPKPPVFNIIDCKRSFDSYDQRLFICVKRPDLFPILTYAEQVAKKACEDDFRHELWNCSNFSLLKQPKITKGGEFAALAVMHGRVLPCDFETPAPLGSATAGSVGPPSLPSLSLAGKGLTPESNLLDGIPRNVFSRVNNNSVD